MWFSRVTRTGHLTGLKRLAYPAQRGGFFGNRFLRRAPAVLGSIRRTILEESFIQTKTGCASEVHGTARRLAVAPTPAVHREVTVLPALPTTQRLL